MDIYLGVTLILDTKLPFLTISFNGRKPHWYCKNPQYNDTISIEVIILWFLLTTG